MDKTHASLNKNYFTSEWNVTEKVVCKSLNPTPHISRRSLVGSGLGLKSKGCWFEPTVRHYFSSNNARLLWILWIKTNHK